MCVLVLVCVCGVCVLCVCWCEIIVVCVRRRAGGGGGAGDTESKTRTPHKDVGKKQQIGHAEVKQSLLQGQGSTHNFCTISCPKYLFSKQL